MKLPMLPLDKANHFVYGTILFTLGSIFSVWLGLTLAVLFGVGKEVYDRVTGRGTPDRMDAIVTAAPAVFLTLAYYFSTLL